MDSVSRATNGSNEDGEQRLLDDLDPGIRRTVWLLRLAGFETTDSGDGKTKLEGLTPEEREQTCAMPFPNVVMRVDDREKFLSETDRLAELVQAWGIDLAQGAIQAIYEPGTPFTIMLLGIDDLAIREAEFRREARRVLGELGANERPPADYVEIDLSHRMRELDTKNARVELEQMRDVLVADTFGGETWNEAYAVVALALDDLDVFRARASDVAETERLRTELANRDTWGPRMVEQAAKQAAELAQLRAHQLAVAQAVGIVYEGDGFAAQPGPDEQVLAEVERLRAELAQARAEVRCCGGCPDCQGIGLRESHAEYARDDQRNKAERDAHDLRARLDAVGDTLDSSGAFGGTYADRIKTLSDALVRRTEERDEARAQLAAAQAAWSEFEGKRTTQLVRELRDELRTMQREHDEAANVDAAIIADLRAQVAELEETQEHRRKVHETLMLDRDRILDDNNALENLLRNFGEDRVANEDKRWWDELCEAIYNALSDARKGAPAGVDWGLLLEFSANAQTEACRLRDRGLTDYAGGMFLVIGGLNALIPAPIEAARASQASAGKGYLDADEDAPESSANASFNCEDPHCFKSNGHAGLHFYGSEVASD